MSITSAVADVRIEIPTRRAGSRLIRWVRWTCWLLSAALFVFGGFRLWRDLEPAPDLLKIERRVRSGDVKAAEQDLRTYLDKSPEHGDARRLLAWLLARKGAKRESAQELHKIPSWWPNKREAQFLEGQSFHELGLARDAEAAWRACVGDDPLHPADPGIVKNAAESLVALFLLEGRLNDARMVLWDAYNQASEAERPAVLGTRMRVELERIEPRESVETLNRQVTADPDDWQSRQALARAYQLAGFPDEADREIQTCLRQQPSNVQVWVAWLSLLRDRNDALGLERAMTQMPAEIATSKNPEIQKVRASVFESAGNLNLARQALELAIQADDYDEETHFRAARVLTRLGDEAAAARHHERYRVLKQARDRLPKELEEFGNLTRGQSRAEARLASITKLADLSETLGWPRLASAWRKQR